VKAINEAGVAPRGRITLKDMIGTGAVSPPLALKPTYKGQLIDAVVGLDEGRCNIEGGPIRQSQPPEGLPRLT